VRRRAALGLLAGWWPVVALAQSAPNPRQLAESLTLTGRPWHAAETLLDASARLPRQDPAFILQSARAELRARRFDRAKSLLVGQPWLSDYGGGEALAVLGAAEWRLGESRAAAREFVAARVRALGPRAALLAVHAALAFEAGGETDSAARYYAAARAGSLGVIDAWLRLREARVQRDTTAARRLLETLPPVVEREASAARAAALLAAGDSLAARSAFQAAGEPLPSVRLSLALGDTAAARRDLYGLFARAPNSEEAGAAVPLARGVLAPRRNAERLALARVLRARRVIGAARQEVMRALAAGDSSGATLMLAAELLTSGGRYHEAVAAYRAAARDSAWTALALYRRARVLVRLGDRSAPVALAGFAEDFPGDTAAPTALYLGGDFLAEHGDSGAATRWFVDLTRRYPSDPRSSLARFRLAAAARGRGDVDSAARLYTTEIDLRGAQAMAARYWLARLAWDRGDSGTADSLWRTLAREDSLGYYGLHARRAARLPALSLAPDSAGLTPLSAAGLARIDTLLLAGLDTEAEAAVRWVLSHPPSSLDDILGWSAGLSGRGWGSAAVRLAWLAAARAPTDARVLRAIYPWPHRAAVEAEAREFGVDPVLFAAIVRQESVFDLDALSRAGARGLAQLMPGTAAQAARGLDVTFYPDWLTVPDLNLHLGAAHLAALLHRFDGRVEVAVAAYNAGGGPVARWLRRPGAEDPDQFIEQIPYPETRGYVRAVLRNRDLYRALYASATN
jgi:soluble lytic murein transglycosylase-like protein/TolA-binding protein